MPGELFEIANQQMRIRVAARGAELNELFNLEHNLAYLWRGDSAFWGKTSPILFPIVGTLKNNQYSWQDKTYVLPRHGFAREKDFTLLRKSNDTLLFQLQEDATTLQVYPFPFQLTIQYTLMEARLAVTYTVVNTGTSPLLFSLGAHPAFALPLESSIPYTDYFLEFSAPENAPIYPLTSDALIHPEPKLFFNQTKQLALHPELFYGDALVFKNLQSNKITLASHSGKRALDFDFPNTPYFGIWSARNAPFICLEPWHGIADSASASGKLEEKEGICTLQPGATFETNWQVTLR